MDNNNENTEEEISIDELLVSIRQALVEKEQKKYFESFFTPTDEDEEIFELSKAMLVQREDVPYQLGVWNFNDVAKKIMKKYKHYFKTQNITVTEKND